MVIIACIIYILSFGCMMHALVVVNLHENSLMKYMFGKGGTYQKSKKCMQKWEIKVVGFIK